MLEQLITDDQLLVLPHPQSHGLSVSYISSLHAREILPFHRMHAKYRHGLTNIAGATTPNRKKHNHIEKTFVISTVT